MEEINGDQMKLEKGYYWINLHDFGNEDICIGYYNGESDSLCWWITGVGAGFAQNEATPLKRIPDYKEKEK